MQNSSECSWDSSVRIALMALSSIDDFLKCPPSKDLINEPHRNNASQYNHRYNGKTT